MTLISQEKGSAKVTDSIHQSVLVEQVMEYLQPQKLGSYIDATVGLGGHAKTILDQSSPTGKILAIDQDQEALKQSVQRLSGYEKRMIFHHGNFSELKTIATLNGFESCDGILADLGVSSMQLSEASRGFSFQNEGPLDMRMDCSSRLKANEVVNYYTENELASLIYKYGEETHSRRIAREIVKARPLNSTKGLANTVVRAIQGKKRGRIHPATQTFQAIRIIVNDELNVLKKFLKNAVELLKPGGRLAVISFHSLEDRIVKTTFKTMAGHCTCPPKLPECLCGQVKIVKLLTRKPVVAKDIEKNKNPRSRSAKLRVAERL